MILSKGDGSRCEICVRGFTFRQVETFYPHKGKCEAGIWRRFRIAKDAFRKLSKVFRYKKYPQRKEDCKYIEYLLDHLMLEKHFSTRKNWVDKTLATYEELEYSQQNRKYKQSLQLVERVYEYWRKMVWRT